MVLNYNLTHDEQAISSIDHPEKLEVMANEYCTLGCPYRTEHYRATSESQIKGVPCAFECKHKPAPQAWGFLNGLIEGDVFLKNDQIRHYANDLGVGSFKIVGRGLSRYDVIDSYLYYLVKPSIGTRFATTSSIEATSNVAFDALSFALARLRLVSATSLDRTAVSSRIAVLFCTGNVSYICATAQPIAVYHVSTTFQFVNNMLSRRPD